MRFDIRTLHESDLPEAMHLVHDVFLEFEAPEYSREGIEEFERFIRPESICVMLCDETLLLWGAFENRNLIGVSALRPPGHISLLFVHKVWHRQGVARILMDNMLHHACAAGAENATVNSSPYAVPVYRRMGFMETATEQQANGIRFTPMSRPL